jgi:hypothetical protein
MGGCEAALLFCRAKFARVCMIFDMFAPGAAAGLLLSLADNPAFGGGLPGGVVEISMQRKKQVRKLTSTLSKNNLGRT